MNFQEISKKKVLGVPVLYVAALAVTVLAVVAWRMKPTPDTTTPGTDPDTALDGITPDDGIAVSPTNPYAGYKTTGTIVVAPETPEADKEPEQKDNETWVREGAEWLTAKKHATGTVAFVALNKYISGEDVSFDENGLINLVIAEKGQPPEPLGKVGAISEQPARKQFSGSNGTHVVKGTNDNTAAKLAQLYYGNGDATHYLRIAQYNTKLGTASTTYPVGTKVVIPSYVTPYYYTVNGRSRGAGKKTDQWYTTIAAIHGGTPDMYMAINPNLSEPIKVGTKVRIR